MAMDKDRLGTAIATTVQIFKPAPGTPITTAILVDMWKAIAGDIITEINDNADIDLALGDIVTPGPSGLLGAAGPGQPVGGAGLNSPIVLAGKIK